MRFIAHPLASSLVVLSLVALSSAAQAEESGVDTGKSLLPGLSPASHSGGPSASSLLPPLGRARALPGRAPANRALPMQIDPGEDNLRTVSMVFPNGEPFATVYLVNVALGAFAPGKEYWYVNLDSISGNLGVHGLTINVTDSNTTSPPSDPGYAPEQRFVQTVNPSGGWGTGWTTDPWSGGDLYAGPNSYYLRFVTTTASPPTVTRVTWYQVLSGGTPADIDPAGSWSASSGRVPVPSGDLGYDISQNNG